MKVQDQTVGGRFNRRRVVGAIAVCLLATASVALWFWPREMPVPLQDSPESVDFQAIKAKAEQGDSESQRMLGSLFAKGQGVKRSYPEAAKWYRLAADQGDAGAQAALGELYEAGQGLPHDEGQAAQWYRRAAEQGHERGQYSLAVLYVLGRGVPRDIDEAVKWYRRAADQGNALAQYNLGMRYKDGDGVGPDAVEAHRWLTLAAAQKLEDAAKALDELRRGMTREQITESQRRAKQKAADP